MPKLGMETIRRRQVVEAVIKILETQGWKDLTIREVSEVAGVSAGIVTHYFGNKRTMTMDSLAEAHHRLEKALADIERRRLGPLPRLLATVELVVNPDATIPGAAFWLALWGRLPFDRLIQAEMNKLRQRTREFLCDIFTQGLAQGVFSSKVPPADIAESFLALSDGLTVASVLDPASTLPARRKELLLAFLRQELGSELAGPAFSVVGSA
jgi:AcrR family transcriptional regulator